MRTRVKIEPTVTGPMGPYTRAHRPNNDPVWVSDAPLAQQGTLILQSKQESMEDSPGFAQTTKTVTHTKHEFYREYAGSYISDVEERTSTTTYSLKGPLAHWQSWGDYGYISHGIVDTFYPKSKEELMRSAMEKFANTNEVNSLLNVVESSQLVSSAGSFVDLLRRLRPHSNRKVGGRDVADTYLAYSFGVAPLISDIKKINAALRTPERDLQRYIRDYDKSDSVTSSVFGLFAQRESYNGGIGYSARRPTTPDSTWWSPVFNWGTPPKLLVGVRGRRRIQYNTDAFKKLHYIISRFVTGGPASFVWERIPFSFVVDWFVDLSSIISALDNTFTGSTLKYEDGWWSEKWTLTARAKKHATAVWASNSDTQLTTINVMSYYHREYLKPHITWGFQDNFGKKQASYLAALLYQMVAKLRR